MRPTWAGFFGLLAIGIPAFLIGAFRASSAEGLGALAVGLLVLFISLVSFLLFGAIAVILAKPSGMWGRIARRVALGLVGSLCVLYGVNSLVLLVADPIPLFVPTLLLLPAGIGALYFLWNDTLRRSVGHSQKK